MSHGKRINEPRQLRALARQLGVRDNWHEPDEQDVTAIVRGTEFDNAGFWGHDAKGARDAHFDGRQEIWVELFKDGQPVAEINLATLLAMACGYGDE